MIYLFIYLPACQTKFQLKSNVPRLSPTQGKFDFQSVNAKYRAWKIKVEGRQRIGRGPICRDTSTLVKMLQIKVRAPIYRSF